MHYKTPKTKHIYPDVRIGTHVEVTPETWQKLMPKITIKGKPIGRVIITGTGGEMDIRYRGANAPVESDLFKHIFYPKDHE